jgi:hypothetical protein
VTKDFHLGVYMNFSTILFAFSTVLISGSAFAKKNCTDQPKEKWMTEEAFKAKVEGEGYKISKFKQPGTCYEIYGTDKDGKKVEIYYNPVDGTPVSKEKKEKK